MRYYRFPYNDWSSLDHKSFDYVIRFENIQDDFSRALALMGIEQVRPLPVRNKTPQRRQDYLNYYTPAMAKRAKRVFGPYLRMWDYEIPPILGDESLSLWNQIEFKLFTSLRMLYWKYLRSQAYPKSIRKAEQIV